MTRSTRVVACSIGQRERRAGTRSSSRIQTPTWSFRRFLTDVLRVPREQILFSINVYTNNGMSLEEIERHWVELLGLPAANARKHMTNHMPTSSSGRAKNKLPFGVCTLRIHNTWMLQHIYGAIQEYGGFEEPGWLDGAY